MITLFTTPKPFQGPWITIQQNALLSYVRFHPDVEILVFDADGQCERFCSQYGIRCLPIPKTNEYGTPLVGPLFKKAMELAAHERIMYINADTILLKDFVSVLERISFDRFLLVGRSWGIEIDGPLDVGLPEDEKWLRKLVEQVGNRRSGSDYFVFTPETWEAVPDFAIGRGVWDRWLLFDVFRRGVPLIDASGAAMVVHQNHDWSNHPDGPSWIWDGPEIKRNRALAAKAGGGFSNKNCTWRLGKSGGPKRVVSRRIIVNKMQLLARGNRMMGYLTRTLSAMLFPGRVLRALQRRIG